MNYPQAHAFHIAKKTCSATTMTLIPLINFRDRMPYFEEEKFGLVDEEEEEVGGVDFGEKEEEEESVEEEEEEESDSEEV